MSDMFPNAGAIGDSVQSLFGVKDYNAASFKMNYEQRLNSIQDQGVNHGVLQGGKSGIASENSPQYSNSKPAATEDPQEVEARWTARLAKYAGIAQSTGVKVGGL